MADSKVCCLGFFLRPAILRGDDLAMCLLLGLPSCTLPGDENLTLAGDSPRPDSGELLEPAVATGSNVSLCCCSLRCGLRELIGQFVTE